MYGDNKWENIGPKGGLGRVSGQDPFFSPSMCNPQIMVTPAVLSLMVLPVHSQTPLATPSRIDRDDPTSSPWTPGRAYTLFPKVWSSTHSAG